jgi:hypothetical protein
MSKLQKEDKTKLERYVGEPELHAKVDVTALALARPTDDNAIIQMFTDAILFGRAYAEIINASDGISLKALDPRYIRERRSRRGKLLGYVQFLTFPLVTFKPEQLLAFRLGDGLKLC